jgi:hypothetical protein
MSLSERIQITICYFHIYFLWLSTNLNFLIAIVKVNYPIIVLLDTFAVADISQDSPSIDTKGPEDIEDFL